MILGLRLWEVGAGRVGSSEGWGWDMGIRTWSGRLGVVGGGSGRVLGVEVNVNEYLKKRARQRASVLYRDLLNDTLLDGKSF